MLGPSGLRQDHLPDDARRLRDRHPRRDPPRRARHQQRPAAQARHRHGVPELRALPAHDASARTSPSRSRCARSARPTASAKVRRALDMVQMGAFARPPPGAALGRPAAARRAGPRAGLRARAGADGRAAGRARQAAARAHAVRDQAHLHDALGITVVYVTHDQTEALTMSDRVAVFNDGRDPAARAARRALRAARRTASSRSSSARTTRCTAPSTAIEGGALHGAARRRRR